MTTVCRCRACPRAKRTKFVATVRALVVRVRRAARVRVVAAAHVSIAQTPMRIVVDVESPVGTLWFASTENAPTGHRAIPLAVSGRPASRAPASVGQTFPAWKDKPVVKVPAEM